MKGARTGEFIVQLRKDGRPSAIYIIAHGCPQLAIPDTLRSAVNFAGACHDSNEHEHDLQRKYVLPRYCPRQMEHVKC